MNRLLAVLLIMLGIGELIIAFAGAKPPLPISLILGGLLIWMGIKSFLSIRHQRTNGNAS